MEKIATICMLHHYAKRLGAVFKKWLFVADDVLVAEAFNSKSYLIDARIRTSLSAFCFSLSESYPIFT